VEAWRSSGVSAREYCQKRGLKVSSLRYWSGRIRRESGAALNEAFEGGPARFAKVQTSKRSSRSSSTESASSPCTAVRLIVGDVQVEVPVGFDAQTLTRVLEVLATSEGAR